MTPNIKQISTTQNRIQEQRKAKGWTLEELATRAGTTKSQINKLESGARRLTVEWMVRLGKALTCDPRDLLTMSAMGAAGFFKTETSEKTLPVRDLSDKAKNMSEATFLALPPIDRILRPSFLEHAREAYALYMKAADMTPMFYLNQILFVAPHKPPTPSRGIVLIMKSGELLVRALVKQKANAIVVRHYAPKATDTTIAMSKVAAVHSICGCWDL